MDPDLERRILLAVFDLVARHGVDGLGMRRVAEATGLSTGTLNYRFTNKRGLLEAAIDFAYRPPRRRRGECAHAGEASLDPRETLERVLERYVLEKPSVRVWWRFYAALLAQSSKDAALRRRLSANARALVAFVASSLQAGAAAGTFAFEGPATNLAERLVALAHGLAMQQLLDTSKATSIAARKLLAAEARSFVA